MFRIKSCVSLAAILLTAAPALAMAANYPVTVFTDTQANGLAGTGPGVAGDLRYAILHAAAGDTITFPGCSTVSPCTIALNGPLPPIMQNQIIDGGAYGAVRIDGSNGAYRAFFIDIGTVTLRNLVIRNVSVVGGAGGHLAGGGLGAGAGLFVNGITASAVVNLDAVYFDGCSAVGGAGGPFVGIITGSGGGGGLAFPGDNSVGAGGGGVTGAGAHYVGGAGGGGGGSDFDTPGVGSAGYATNPGGLSGPTPYGAGAGGFGGGGGGGFNGGATGGFGGGGGIRSSGGFGGGGGGNQGGGFSPAFYGGTLGGYGVGGNAAGQSGGGGGGAAGPCIFVNQGQLNITNSGFGGTVSAIGGAAGGAMATAGTGLSSPVYLARGDNAGTIAGAVTSTVTGSSVTQSTQGIVAGALRSGEPVFVAPTPVPTLSGWAIILLGLTLASGAAFAVQRRRMTA